MVDRKETFRIKAGDRGRTFLIEEQLDKGQDSNLIRMLRKEEILLGLLGTGVRSCLSGMHGLAFKQSLNLHICLSRFFVRRI